MADLLDQIEIDGQRLLALGRSDPTRQIPQYPGWTATDLVVHTAMVHGRTIEICQSLPRERVSAPRLATGADPFEWAEANLFEMTAALRRSDLSSPVWSFTSNATLGFWVGRMAIETAVHRWDMDQAFGEPGSLAPAVAQAGLDEFEEMWMPRMDRLPPLRMHATDIDMTWIFGGAEPAERVEGSASELYLRLMSRGDLALPAAWAAAVDEVAGPSKP